jgi:hypothetical protein
MKNKMVLLLTLIYMFAMLYSCSYDQREQENGDSVIIMHENISEADETANNTDYLRNQWLIGDDITILNLEHIIAENLDFDGLELVEVQSGGYVAYSPQELAFLGQIINNAESVWWSEEMPSFDANVAVHGVPGGFIMTYKPMEGPDFYKKYIFGFGNTDNDVVGGVTIFFSSRPGQENYLLPRTLPSSERGHYDITSNSAGRIFLHRFSHGHDGWPSVIVNNGGAKDTGIHFEAFITSR